MKIAGTTGVTPHESRDLLVAHYRTPKVVAHGSIPYLYERQPHAYT